jgi:hypothetical protein
MCAFCQYNIRRQNSESPLFESGTYLEFFPRGLCETRRIKFQSAIAQNCKVRSAEELHSEVQGLENREKNVILLFWMGNADRIKRILKKGILISGALARAFIGISATVLLLCSFKRRKKK